MKCSECGVRIYADEQAVSDGHGGLICEDCQRDR